VTELGRALARLPLPPRLGRLVLEAARRGVLAEGALLAALLSERAAVRRPSPAESAALPDTDSDVLERWRDLRAAARSPESRTGTTGPAVRRVLQAARQIERLASAVENVPRERSSRGDSIAASSGVGAPPPGEATAEALRRSLLAAYPDRVARRRAEDPDRALMVGGRGLRMGPTSRVRRAPLFVCVEVQGAGRDATVHQASAIEAEWLDAAAVRIEETVELDSRGKIVARRRRLYHDLVLEEAPLARPDPSLATDLLVAAASQDPSAALGLNREPARGWVARVDFLRRLRPELALPDYSDEATLLEILVEAASGRGSLDELREAPVLDLLRARLGWEQLRRLDELAPERIRLASGRSAALVYEIGKPPVLAARIQDLFGWRETPRIAGGAQPLLLHLLAPNGRPQQITDDLAGFWERTYPEVRKELAGRYPKHAWPEDPRALPARPAGARSRRR
jgi:ATP-dependent helicase HrpB